MKRYLNRRPSLALADPHDGVSGFVALPDTSTDTTSGEQGQTLSRPIEGAQGETLSSPVAEGEEGQTLTAPIAALRLSHVVMPRGPSRSVQAAEVAELEALRAQSAFISFRAFRAFAYSVDLLFYGAELAYYVTLSQEERPWRVLRTAEFDSADAAFRHFEEQALRLAAVEARHAQLEAHTQQLSKLLAASEQRAEKSREDLDRHTAATRGVTSRQQQLRKQVAQLEAQRVAAQAQLNQTQRQVQRLCADGNEWVPYLATRRIER